MAEVKVKSKDIIGALAHLGYEFRLNVLTDRILVNKSPISDVMWAEIRSVCRDRGYKSAQQVMDAVTWEAARHPYHPIKEWLNGQMSWDGTPHIQKLCSYFTDSDGVFPFLMEKWLLGAVGKVLTDGLMQNPMLVLDGNQQIGKSYFCGWLLPPELRQDFYLENAIHPDQKDDEFRLMSKLVWEVQELGSTTRKADAESLKRFLTMNQVVGRKAYGREDLIKPALASFIGTINNSVGFLMDATGHRRFRPCNITAIDWSYKDAVYQGDIWAEAYARYLMGETNELTPAEQKQMQPVLERYEVIDPYTEGLIKYFHIEPNNPHEFMTTFDILTHLQNSGFPFVDPLKKYDQMQLREAATRLGLTKHKDWQTRLNGYRGIRTKP